MGLAWTLALGLYLQKLKGHISQDSFAGITVNLQSIFIGTDLVLQTALRILQRKRKELIFQDSFAGIYVNHLSIYIGIYLALMNVQHR